MNHETLVVRASCPLDMYLITRGSAVCDESFAMLGSHNFLTSGSSSPELEVGIFTNDQNIIHQLIEHFDISRFDKNTAIDYLNREPSNYNFDDRPIETSVLVDIISKFEVNKLQPRPSDIILPVGETIIITPISNKKHIYDATNENDVSVSDQVLQSASKLLGDIFVNLNWKQIPFIASGNPKYKEPIDLDLCCLYEMTTGAKNCIQALGKNFGNYAAFPYILLHGDDRTGNDLPNGETLQINGSKIHQFKRILIYTFIYNGIANWSEIDAVLTIRQLDIINNIRQPDIVVKLDNCNDNQTRCAIALLTITDKTVEISNQIQYFSDHLQMDRYFGWGLNWVPGSKEDNVPDNF